ncbi:MAG: hypothetical protein R6X32_19655 [Chloroflexota bacterium]
MTASLSANPSAQETADWLKKFLDLSQQLVLARPPATVRSALRHRFDEQQRQVPRSPSLWQRVSARLTFDSSQQMAVAGMRAAILDDTIRQLVYATPRVEIALHLQPGPDDRIALYGQVFPLHETADTIYAVQLCRAGSDNDSGSETLTATDEFGEFSFQAINMGTYEVILSSDQLEVVITPVTFSH